MVADFEFNWKYKDFEIRTAHHYGADNSPYIELVKWEKNNGRQYCFTLAYWHRDNDGYRELHFVGKRPLVEIADIDLSPIWKQLFLAQAILEDAEEKSREI